MAGMQQHFSCCLQADEVYVLQPEEYALSSLKCAVPVKARLPVAPAQAQRRC